MSSRGGKGWVSSRPQDFSTSGGRRGGGAPRGKGRTAKPRGQKSAVRVRRAARLAAARKARRQR